MRVAPVPCSAKRLYRRRTRSISRRALTLALACLTSGVKGLGSGPCLRLGFQGCVILFIPLSILFEPYCSRVNRKLGIIRSERQTFDHEPALIFPSINDQRFDDKTSRTPDSLSTTTTRDSECVLITFSTLREPQSPTTKSRSSYKQPLVRTARCPRELDRYRSQRSGRVTSSIRKRPSPQIHVRLARQGSRSVQRNVQNAAAALSTAQQAVRRSQTQQRKRRTLIESFW